jgi:transcriptional regulator with XRE-family HTH domain
MEKTELLKKVGKNICFHRKRLSLSQEELAKRTDVSLRTIQRAETGATELRMKAFVSICHELGVSMDAISNETR